MTKRIRTPQIRRSLSCPTYARSCPWLTKDEHICLNAFGGFERRVRGGRRERGFRSALSANSAFKLVLIGADGCSASFPSVWCGGAALGALRSLRLTGSNQRL